MSVLAGTKVKTGRLFTAAGTGFNLFLIPVAETDAPAEGVLLAEGMVPAEHVTLAEGVAEVSEGVMEAAEPLVGVSEGMMKISTGVMEVSEGLVRVSEVLTGVSEGVAEAAEGVAGVAEYLMGFWEGVTGVAETFCLPAFIRHCPVQEIEPEPESLSQSETGFYRTSRESCGILRIAGELKENYQ